MRAFRADGPGMLRADFDGHERRLLAGFAAQLIELLEGRDGTDAEAGEDPALARLLPNAYPDDEDAAAEFRRFTAGDIAQRKVLNARTVIASLADSRSGASAVRLDASSAQAWLRTLTDIRLTVDIRLSDAARLGVAECEPGPQGDGLDVLREIYGWLGFVQQSLVEALDT